MRVRAKLNQQDVMGRVYLINDVFEIKDEDFDSRLHSEEMTQVKKATKGRGKATRNVKPKDGDVNVRADTAD